MGVELFPSYDKPCKAARFDHDGKLLMREFDVLDAICRETGAPEFSSFGNSPQIPEGFEGDFEALEALMEENEEYFDPGQGLECLRALLEQIPKGGGAVARLSDPERMLEDLRALRKCLEIARAEGCRFRYDYA